MTDTVRTTVESFTSGNVLGDVFSNVSTWLGSVLNTGNIFFSKDMDSSFIFPELKGHSSYVTNPHYKRINRGQSYSDLGITISYPDWTQLDIIYYGGNKESYVIPSEYPYFQVLRRFDFNSTESTFTAYCYLDKGSSSDPWAVPSVISKDSTDWPSGFYEYLYFLLTDSALPDIENTSLGIAHTIPEYLPDSSDEANALTSGTTVFVPTSFETLWETTPEQLKTGDFVDVPVVPDIPITGETSGTISGEGSGTGVFEGVGSWVMDIPVLGDILGALRGVWDSVKGIAGTVSTIAAGVAALASGEVPAELETRIKQFSGQIFDLLSWDELSQSMEALENFGSGYGEPPVISINLHNLLEPAQNIGRFDNEFNNTETTVIDFKILEDERFGFMGMTLIELIRMMAAISMIWYTAWYVWEKIVPDDAVR